MNDNSPEFTSALYSGSASEDAAGGTSVARVTATDADSGTAGSINYVITGGDGSGQFVISTSGVINIASSPTIDYESKASYTLLITASDGGMPSLSSQCVVTIDITDINDNAPVFDVGNFVTSVEENLLSGTSVTQVGNFILPKPHIKLYLNLTIKHFFLLYQLIATDADTSAFGPVTFSIASGDSNGHFSIDSSTAEITTTTTLDRESINRSANWANNIYLTLL